MATISQPITKTQPQPGSTAWEFLRRELAPTPDRLSATVRAVICAVIITLIGEAARSQALFIALFIILSLPRDYPKQTLKASLSVAAVVIVSALVALLLQAIAADLSWARVLLIFASVFFGMLIGRKLNQPLVGVLIAVMTAQTLLVYDSISNSEAVVEGTLWFVLMFIFGVSIATVVEYLFPHPTPLQRLTGGLQQQLQAAGTVFKSISGASMTDEERKQARAINQLSATGITPLSQLLASVSSAHLLSEQDLLRLNSLLPDLELLTDLAAQLSRYGTGDFDEGQRKFAAGLSESTFHLAKQLKQPQVTLKGQKPDSLTVNSRSVLNQSLLLSQTGEVLNALWSAWYLESEFSAKTYKEEAHPPKKSSLSPQPFFNRDSVHFSFKVALASIICYILFSAVNWPSISTSLVTCFIVALDTVGTTYRKLVLRLAGVVFGGLLLGIGGISLVLSRIDNVVELSLYVALVFFIAGWVVKGSQRISYAGVQIGLSFALVAMSTPTIPNQIVEARDRFLGVLLGAIVMWFVFGHLWPVDAITGQRSKLAELIRDVAELLQLSIDERSKGERIARLHELRDSANQAILTANDQADASRYDSLHHPELQQNLRDCLAKAQALLMLEIIEVGLSIEHATSEPALNADRKKLTDDYASFLCVLSEKVKAGNQEQLEPLARQLTALQTKLDQSLAHGDAPEQARDEETYGYLQARDRIARRRQAHVADLLQSVQKL